MPPPFGFPPVCRETKVGKLKYFGNNAMALRLFVKTISADVSYSKVVISLTVWLKKKNLI